MLWLAVSAAALIGGFIVSRGFVRRRLRFVDAMQRPSVPLIAGIIWLGVYPAPVLRRMETAATRFVQLVETRALRAVAER